MDIYNSNQNDIVSESGACFAFREDGDYTDEISKVLKYILELPDIKL